MSERVIRRAYRHAHNSRAEFLAIFCVETPLWEHASSDEKRVLEQNLRLAEDLGAELVRVHSDAVAEAILRVAHERNVMQIVLSRSHRPHLLEVVAGSTVASLLRAGTDVDIDLVADRQNA